MRIVFAGTPEFASTALQAILKAGHDVRLVLTQPDRPAGRGMKLQPSAVKKLAQEHNIRVLQPASLRLDGRYGEQAKEAQAILQAQQADVMVVAAYGLILPQWVLQLPRFGCLNIHASLLPRWRGAAPIHRAIEAADTQTGITIMQMDEGLDTGSMLEIKAIPIGPTDTTGTLHDRLAALGGELIVHTLADLQKGGLTLTPQPQEGVTYAHKIDKAESRIQWQEGATTLAQRIRAFNPYPGAYTLFKGQTIKLWQACAIETGSNANQTQPGQILQVDATSIRIATGKGVLQVTELQRAGGKRQQAREFLQAMPLKSGDILGD